MSCTVMERSLSASDTINTLVCHFACPEGKPRGIVQISHGMCEHMGRYRRFMEFLAEEGFLVCGQDHIGHGKTCPRDEMLGYFGEEGGFRYLVQDLRRVNEFLHEEYPGVPLFLFGHSMGSMIVRLYLSKFPDSLTGVILSGTAGPNPASKAGLALCNAVIASKGSLYRPKAVDRMVFGAYNKRYEKPRTEKDWLTREPAVIDAFLSDPRCNFLFTAAGYRDLLSLQYYCNTRTWYQTLSSALPCLILSGEMDPVGDFGKGVKKVYEGMKKAGVTDLTCRLYPEARHELLNETNYEEVQQDILNWLNQHLPAEDEIIA